MEKPEIKTPQKGSSGIDQRPVATSRPPQSITMVNARPWTSIMPGDVNNPIRINIPANAVTGIRISVYFAGPSPNQLVTVKNGNWLGMFQSITPNVWNSLHIPQTPGTQQSITVTGTADQTALPNTPYANCFNSPVINPIQINPNLFGIDVTTYSMNDGSGNMAIVVIQDDAVTAP
jgi:hypothetical protein